MKQKKEIDDAEMQRLIALQVQEYRAFHYNDHTEVEVEVRGNIVLVRDKPPKKQTKRGAS